MFSWVEHEQSFITFGQLDLFSIFSVTCKLAYISFQKAINEGRE